MGKKYLSWNKNVKEIMLSIFYFVSKDENEVIIKENKCLTIFFSCVTHSFYFTQLQ